MFPIAAWSRPCLPYSRRALLAVSLGRVWLAVRTGMLSGGSWIPPVVTGAVVALARVNQFRSLSLLRWPEE
ncbi:MAG TPA: hypothetical protein VHG28_07755 [Longimicrobiaceae bacterium]|nr:hypothetical protein [Longimicrobiaceae bacterium]